MCLNTVILHGTLWNCTHLIQCFSSISIHMWCAMHVKQSKFSIQSVVLRLSSSFYAWHAKTIQSMCFTAYLRQTLVTSRQQIHFDKVSVMLSQLNPGAKAAGAISPWLVIKCKYALECIARLFYEGGSLYGTEQCVNYEAGVGLRHGRSYQAYSVCSLSKVNGVTYKVAYKI